MARFTVTYDTLTEESIEAGDVADNGWIQPVTEKQRSLRKGGSRMYERNVRMSRKGAFNWRLRDALEWLENNAEGPLSHDGHLDQGRVETEGRIRDVWALSVRFEADGYEHAATKVEYELNASDLSHGLRERLRRLFEAKGVRFY